MASDKERGTISDDGQLTQVIPIVLYNSQFHIELLNFSLSRIWHIVQNKCMV